MSEGKKFEIKAMYKSEIAAAYEVSLRVMNNMIEKTAVRFGDNDFGEYTGKKMLTPKQIKLIVEHNGPPYE